MSQANTRLAQIPYFRRRAGQPVELALTGGQDFVRFTYSRAGLLEVILAELSAKSCLNQPDSLFMSDF